MIFQNFHLSYSPHKFGLFLKMPLLFFYFRKYMFYSIILIFLFYLQHCHFHQYTSDHEQPISSSKFIENRQLHLHFIHTQTISPSLSLSFYSKIIVFYFKFYKLVGGTQIHLSQLRTHGQLSLQSYVCLDNLNMNLTGSKYNVCIFQIYFTKKISLKVFSIKKTCREVLWSKHRLVLQLIIFCVLIEDF